MLIVESMLCICGCLSYNCSNFSICLKVFITFKHIEREAGSGRRWAREGKCNSVSNKSIVKKLN